VSEELWRHGAGELAELIASREVSSREVVDAHLERIEAVNAHLNAVVLVLADEARAAADAADAATERSGPLHGVPFTVKENIDVAGTPTTSGIAALAEAVSPVDAPQVERLRRAGAIPIARTNLPDLGAGPPLGGGGWVVANVIAVTLISPFVEELFFRGLLLPRMRAVFGRGDWVANGTIFTAYHLHQPWSMPATLLDGIFAQAYPARRFRSIWIGVVGHTLPSLVLIGVVLSLVIK